MTLSAGSRLGPYEIVSPIGAGGMGEVYRARDSRLGRDVAIKVLPESMSSDPERLARFEQEARATAALNHPNILALHDIGTSPSPYLVTELLDGESLRARLERGALPARKAIECATQLAAGLAAAHEKGIAHRDLKPENIFITADGHTKILDFGLAKLVGQSGAAGPAAFDSAQAREAGHYVSTLATAAPGTTPGVVLGTVGYMAPEQVKGLPADHRSDIFAFGATLYEMLSGRRAFQKGTAAETMTAILNEEPPDLSVSLQPVPPALDRIIRRCLEKSPSARFQSTRDLAFALEGLSSGSGVGTASSASPRLSSGAWGWQRVSAVAALAFAIVSAGLAYLLWRQPAMPPVAFTVAVPPDWVPSAYAVSPDGRTIVFVAGPVGQTAMLHVRRLDAIDATPLRGTERARNPFWSADGQSIGFFADDSLKTVPAAGGTVRAVCRVVGARTWGTWNADGVIVFSTENKTPLRQVPAEGGTPSDVTRLEVTNGRRHLRPQFLPGGRRFLYYSDGEVRLASLDSTDDVRVLDQVGYAEFVEPGYLVFIRGSQVQAQPFDASAGTLSGRAVTIGEVGTFQSGVNPTSNGFSVSRGTVAFRTIGETAAASLTWFDRRGQAGATVGEPDSWRNVQFSPDRSRMAVQRAGADTRGAEVWVFDLGRNVGSRVTLDGDAGGVLPVWAPSGTLFMIARPGGLVAVPWSGGRPAVVMADERGIEPNSVSPDGRLLAYTTINAGTNRDIGVVETAGGTPRLLINGAANEVHAQISPDGQWIAYESDEAGLNDVYLQRFPSGGRNVRVSTGGGLQPRWRADGRELYYLAIAAGATRANQVLEPRVTAVTVSTVPELQLGQPSVLFPVRMVYAGGLGTIANYDVSTDGQRFMIAATVGEQREAPITVITNWQSLLAR